MSILDDKADRVHRRAEMAGEVFEIGLQAADVVLSSGAVPPIVVGICRAARNVLQDVLRLHDRADDVIAAGRRVVNVLETLQWIAENAKSVQGWAKQRVEESMLELHKLLNAVRDAVRAFDSKGFFKKMFHVAKEAKTLKRLDRDIRDALDNLREAYALARDHKFEQLLQDQSYALEEAIEKQIRERINKREANAVEGLENNTGAIKAFAADKLETDNVPVEGLAVNEVPIEAIAIAVEELENDQAAIEAIAVDGGVSDDVFSREVSDFRFEIRDKFNRSGHQPPEIRDAIQLAKPKDTVDSPKHDKHFDDACVDGRVAKHYEHVAFSHANRYELPHLQSMLGRGFLGTTHKMRAVNTYRECAVKLISLAMARFFVPENELLREVAMLTQLQHEHVVPYCDVRVVMTPWLGKCVAIIMEYLPGGSLRERIMSSEMDAQTATNWVIQLASGLAHAHRYCIQHRDLTLDNVLLDARDGVLPQRSFSMSLVVRIIGFGLACVHKSASFIAAPKSSYDSRFYRSPEKAQGCAYGYKDDIWAVGCIAASLFTGKPPEERGVSVENDFALHPNLVIDLKDEVLSKAPEGAGHVVVDCLNENPAKRPTAVSVEYRLRGSQWLWWQIDLSKLPRVSWWIDPYIKHAMQKLVVDKDRTDDAVLEAVLLLLNGDAAAARATLATREAADALVFISVTFTCNKMNEDALGFARRAVDAQGSNAATWLWFCAVLRLVDASVDEQDEAISMSFVLDPSDSLVRFTKARFLHAVRKDYDSAECEFKLTIAADPSCSLAHNGYGTLLYDGRKNYVDAEREYQLAIKADPRNSQAHSNYGWLLHDAYKDYDGAEHEYKLAIDLDPSNWNAHNNYGILLHDVRKDYVYAEREFRLAIKADPKNAIAHCNYGALLQEVRNDYDGAEFEYQQAIKADQSSSLAHTRYGILLQHVRKDYAGAESAYKRAVVADPSNSGAHNWYGILLQDVRKDFDGAEREYELAIMADPKNSMAHNCYGILLQIVRKDFAGAERQYKLAIEADPNNAIAHTNYGIFLSKVYGDYEGAEREYKLAIKADPKNSNAHNSYGNLLKNWRNDVEAAKEEYEKAIRFDPNNKIAFKNLAKLQRKKFL